MKEDSTIIEADGDGIDINGVNLEPFMSNPVVFWDFNHDIPVGTATNIKKGKDSITCELKIDKAYSDVVNEYTLGCGYRVIEKQGNIVTKSELIEVSILK